MRRMAGLLRFTPKALLGWGVLGLAFLSSGFQARAGGSEADLSAMDPAFEPGLAILRKTKGIVEELPDKSGTLWAPDLQLLIGVKATEGAKQELYFVELTTLAAPTTDPSSQTPWHTNRIDLAGVHSGSGTNTPLEFRYRLAPVRVCVFDRDGRALNQGQAEVPWELMTNSLADVCRFCLAMQTINKVPAGDEQGRKNAALALFGTTNTAAINWDKFMRPIAGGFLSLGGLFAECASTPALHEVCEKAHCTIRLPGVWSLVSAAFGAKLDLSLDPRFMTDVSVVHSHGDGKGEPWYRFPADLKSKNKKLVSVEFVVGPSRGALVLLGGIRLLKAVHPTKPDRQFMAQVLAAGKARTDTVETSQRTK